MHQALSLALSVSLLLPILGAAAPLAVAAEPPHVGIYSCMDLRSALYDFQGANTYLEYVVLDTDHTRKPILNSVDELIPVLQTNRKIQKAWARPLNLQLGIEMHKTNLELFIKEMSQKGSETYKKVAKLARALKQETQTVYIRPFSEMNDQGVAPGPKYTLDPTGTTTNTPENYAKAWVILYDTLVENGFTHFKTHFNVLAARNVGPVGSNGNMELVMRALEAIPRKYVDAFGLNVYARPDGWTQTPAIVDLANNPIGATDLAYVPFAELAQPWIDRVRRSKHSDLPIVGGEFGCSNQGTDANKAKWIREAFQYGRDNSFQMLTYFNCTRYNWAAIIGSESEKELKAQISRGLKP